MTTIETANARTPRDQKSLILRAIRGAVEHRSADSATTLATLRAIAKRHGFDKEAEAEERSATLAAAERRVSR